MPKRQRLTRQESKARTRAELLHAAGRLFLRDGYVSTSLSAIAEEAALTKGAVYSNFESKEDLFLALLQAQDRQADERYAPSDLAKATGRTPADRARAWGRYTAKLRPSKRHVALFLENNAVSLRNDRVRTWVAGHNAAFFESLGTELAEVLDAPDADPATLGVVAQSLYVGLMLHGAFNPELVDEELFAKAYALLAHLDDAERRQ